MCESELSRRVFFFAVFLILMTISFDCFAIGPAVKDHTDEVLKYLGYAKIIAFTGAVVGGAATAVHTGNLKAGGSIGVILTGAGLAINWIEKGMTF